MSAWENDCRRQLQFLCGNDAVLASHVGPALEGIRTAPSLHLAVFVEPYLSFILDGRKTVESRFSAVRCAPYDRVRAGDVILLKRAGGPVVGVCRATSAYFYELDGATLREIKANFSRRICPAESNFWSSRANASFATLISVSDVYRTPNFKVKKRDRRGWVTFSRTVMGQRLLYV